MHQHIVIVSSAQVDLHGQSEYQLFGNFVHVEFTSEYEVAQKLVLFIKQILIAASDRGD